MSPKQLEQFKKSLAKEKKTIERELNEIGNKNPKIEGNFDVRFPQYGQSKDENAQEVTEFEKLKILEASLEKRLTEVNETLKKIKEDGFGICQNCSNKIEGPRLKAMPTAALCASCAKKI
ncbi:MAG: TraR/DksA C4-type zinc finger protein [Patescibacteria group bacterium]